MSYKHKDIFIESLSNFIYPGKIFDEALSELDHVYAQAAKADEYEKSKYRAHVNDYKAEAFDLICEAMDYHYPTVNDRKYLNGYQHPKASLKDIDAIINSYESGESE